MARTSARSVILLGVILVLCALTCSKSRPESAQGQGKAQQAARSFQRGAVARYRTAVVIDNEGTGIEALRLLVPADWQVSSQLRWLLDNPGMPATLALRAYGPEDGAEFELFPNQSFFWTDNEMTLSIKPPGSRYFGAEVRAPVSALAALKTLVVPKFRSQVSGLEVVAEQVLPELAQAVGAGLQSQPGVKASADGAKVRIRYVKDGRAYEEEIYGVVEKLAFSFSTMLGYQTNTMWYVDYTFSFKAEQGKLDKYAKTFGIIAHSVRLNPLWYSKYNQTIEYLAQRQIQQIQSIGQLSRILSQTSNQISDMMMQSYNQRQAASDRIAQDFSDYMLNIDRYNDPVEGKQVELPSGYQSAWVNGQGEYVLSERQDFNPNVGSTQQWRQLIRP